MPTQSSASDKANAASETASETDSDDDHDAASDAHEDAAGEAFKKGDVDAGKKHAAKAKEHRHKRGLKPNPLAAWAKKRSA
jgi:hypothetical protein